MKKKKTLTADRLKELLRYDPLTGVFYWRGDMGSRARRGGIAGCISKRKRGSKYIVIRLLGKLYLAHRLAVLWMTGDWPSGQVDHIDRDGLNNQWWNLRPASNSQNQANRRPRSDSATGLKGVTHLRERERYMAQIQSGNEHRYLGVFDTPEEAHAAYVAAAQKHFGEYARAQ